MGDLLGSGLTLAPGASLRTLHEQLPPRDVPRLADKLTSMARDISQRIGGRAAR